MVIYIAIGYNITVANIHQRKIRNVGILSRVYKTLPVNTGKKHFFDQTSWFFPNPEKIL